MYGSPYYASPYYASPYYGVRAASGTGRYYFFLGPSGYTITFVAG